MFQVLVLTTPRCVPYTIATFQQPIEYVKQHINNKYTCTCTCKTIPMYYSLHFAKFPVTVELDMLQLHVSTCNSK